MAVQTVEKMVYYWAEQLAAAMVERTVGLLVDE